MIQVSVGEQHQVDVGQLRGFQGTSLATNGPKGARAKLRPNSRKENGIGNDMHPMEVDQNRRVPQPGGAHMIRIPVAWNRFMPGGNAWLAQFRHAIPQKADESTRRPVLNPVARRGFMDCCRTGVPAL